MIIIYYKNRFISISESESSTLNSINIEFNKIHDINIEIYKFLANNNIKNLHLFGKNPEKILKKLKKSFNYVKAAGGVVVNENNEILFIKRRGKWDLPKGKKDKGESIQITAIREVSEECGIDPEFILLKNYIDSTWHIYDESTEFILKRTYWYTMKYVGNEELVPQADEDITQAKWFNLHKLEKPLNKTFLNIQYIIELFISQCK
ncbi:MAG: NUDIX domain-containing protein [Bacteroidales bacterium]|nr:NUDIX domain-containing protein [Bacteroidales bacterium]